MNILDAAAVLIVLAALFSYLNYRFLKLPSSGGISVALALSLPEFEGRTALLNATYGVVIFSVIVQGLTIGPLIRSISNKEPTHL